MIDHDFDLIKRSAQAQTEPTFVREKKTSQEGRIVRLRALVLKGKLLWVGVFYGYKHLDIPSM
jgi:hypothetical protein